MSEKWIDLIFDVGEGDLVAVELRDNKSEEALISEATALLQEEDFDFIRFVQFAEPETVEVWGLDTF